MIVYSDRRASADPRALARDLLARLGGAAGPDALTALLIDAGVLESGVADALAPEEDAAHPVAGALRGATLSLARAVRDGAGGAHLAAARASLEAALAGPLPARVEVSEPEGFAFYDLRPEAYLRAGRRLAARRPPRVLVMGLRSIGTTLSALVAAALEAEGIEAESLTVRPRGHPWDRALRLDAGLRARLAAAGHVAVVDEGPGLSGSSFAAGAEAARAAGIPDDRIVLVPSWDADPSALRSDRGRAAWERHPREVAVPPPDDPAAPWGGGRLRDLSGGLWRDLHWPGQEGRPAVQPQHERRKVLLERDGAPPLLLKFAGLGRRGERMLDRARAQAGGGRGPEAVGLASGVLALRWHEGRPARAGDLDAGLVGAMAAHLARLARDPDPAVARADDALRMAETNVREGLGEAAAGRALARMTPLAALAAARPAVAGDNRMMPHEWLLTPSGPLKADGLDHHDDHFWPGRQDPAWDLAGAAWEWGMDAAAREALVSTYVDLTGDRGARAVLPFHEAAYLAWVLGYASLAAESLAGEEHARMAARRDAARASLAALLSRQAA